MVRTSSVTSWKYVFSRLGYHIAIDRLCRNDLFQLTEKFCRLFHHVLTSLSTLPHRKEFTQLIFHCLHEALRTCRDGLEQLPVPVELQQHQRTFHDIRIIGMFRHGKPRLDAFRQLVVNFHYLNNLEEAASLDNDNRLQVFYN